MPVINRVAALADEVTEWRRDIHAHPETAFNEHRTAAVVADKLRAFGVDEVVTGVGRTGVVGVIKGKKAGGGKTIGLRADMDALPLSEETGLAYASQNPGAMHACGHDGHTAMLLGAAKYLAETRNFSGTAVVIFQPAEEGGGGGREMVQEGLMTRFGVEEVYGMHNMPQIPIGHWAIRPGSLMAAADTFEVKITGKGAHAARPHESLDPVVAASHMIIALQTIAARNVNPLDSIVVSVTAVETGKAFNIIPQTAVFRGTVRTLKKETRELAQKRITDIVSSLATAFGVKADLDYLIGYPVTINHEKETGFAIEVAREVSGEANVVTDTPPLMGAEDFSYMLEERPGAYIFIGNGATAGVHNPAYDFNDAAIPYGVSFFARVIEKAAA
ncbi:MAG: amidohydrolase [Rhizobiales bacterium 65-9]|nr:amidohydrolase [Hyphomicrobiales bacterium]OJY36478.1 MAG: amidohydrolase [Rhizobiales bacterium 65-9]